MSRQTQGATQRAGQTVPAWQRFEKINRMLPPDRELANRRRPGVSAFSKLKAFLRAARPRTFQHVCESMATAMTAL
jgi:hypothetical protein